MQPLVDAQEGGEEIISTENNYSSNGCGVPPTPRIEDMLPPEGGVMKLPPLQPMLSFIINQPNHNPPTITYPIVDNHPPPPTTTLSGEDNQQKENKDNLERRGEEF